MPDANISISIRRSNGAEINASGVVPDETVAETASMLSALLFEQSLKPAEESNVVLPQPQVIPPTPAPPSFGG